MVDRCSKHTLAVWLDLLQVVEKVLIPCSTFVKTTMTITVVIRLLMEVVSAVTALCLREASLTQL
jgi:hypothetical protein